LIGLLDKLNRIADSIASRLSPLLPSATIVTTVL
jgi:hypothetical protein